MRIKLCLLFLLLGVVGCMDPRIKREISFVNVMTATAAKEYKAAPNNEEKVKVADEFFDNAPKHTQVLEDYAFGVKPK